MQDNTSPEPNNGCPKRPWVLLTLSDDEQIGAGDALPRGLAFHLSRCSECKALAHDLMAVTRVLRTAAEHDPTDDLMNAVQTRAIAALHNGAQLTGRVDVSDDGIEQTGQLRSSGLGAYARLAAAASVILVVGISGYLARTTNSEPGKVAPASVADSHRMEPDVNHHAFGQEQSTALVSTKERAHQEVDPKLASSTAHAPAEYRIRHHHSHIEAALSDDPHGAQAAWIIPDTSKRDVGWFGVFDRPSAVLSTNAPDEKR